MLLNTFRDKKRLKGVAQHKFAIAHIRKKQYLCSRKIIELNLFCTLKIKQTNTMEK